MKLKYQTEIDNFNLTVKCPTDVSLLEDDMYAYRFSLSPITDVLNFLPNVLYDRLKPAIFNYTKASEEKKCKRCGSSYFSDKKKAFNSWNSLSEKIQENLGYSHLAYGILKKSDGWVTNIEESSHFSFYEEENAYLFTQFQIIEEL